MEFHGNTYTDRSSENLQAFHKVCSASAEALRLGLQYGFLPLVIYLGFKQGGELPNGEHVEFGLLSLLWG